MSLAISRHLKTSTRLHMFIVLLSSTAIVAWSWWIGQALMRRFTTSQMELARNVIALSDVTNASGNLFIAGLDESIHGTELKLNDGEAKEFTDKIAKLSDSVAALSTGPSKTGIDASLSEVKNASNDLFSVARKAGETEGLRLGALKSLAATRIVIRKKFNERTELLNEQLKKRTQESKKPITIPIDGELNRFESTAFDQAASTSIVSGERAEIVYPSHPDADGQKVRPSKDEQAVIDTMIKNQIDEFRTTRTKTLASMDHKIGEIKTTLAFFSSAETASSILISILTSESREAIKDTITSYAADIAQYNRKVHTADSLRLDNESKEAISHLDKMFSGADSITENYDKYIAGSIDLITASKNLSLKLAKLHTSVTSLTNEIKSQTLGYNASLDASWKTHFNELALGGVVTMLLAVIAASLCGRRTSKLVISGVTTLLTRVKTGLSAQRERIDAMVLELDHATAGPGLKLSSASFTSGLATSFSQILVSLEGALGTFANGHSSSLNNKDRLASLQATSSEVIAEIDRGRSDISGIVTMLSDITKKTHVIHDIAFQSRLLSFNASVEAARAGEHGKGFAVVAEEIAKLAGMSGDAAKDITTVLNTHMQQVKKITEESNARISRLSEKLTHEFSKATDSSGIEDHNSNSAMITKLESVVKDSKEYINAVNQANSRLEEADFKLCSTMEESKLAAQRVKKTLGEISEDLLIERLAKPSKPQTTHKTASIAQPVKRAA